MTERPRRASAGSGSIPAAAQAAALAALKWPLSASIVCGWPRSAGTVAGLPSIGSACCSPLLLVVGGLHDIGGGHQQAVRRHHGWRVAALREATARHRHDAGVRVGRIDLVGGSGPRGRRRRRPAAKLLAARLRRGRARRDFALVRRLLADQAPGGAGFDLGCGPRPASSVVRRAAPVLPGSTPRPEYPPCPPPRPWHGLWAQKLDGEPVIGTKGHEFQPIPTVVALEAVVDDLSQVAKDLNHARLGGFLRNTFSKLGTTPRSPYAGAPFA